MRCEAQDPRRHPRARRQRCRRRAPLRDRRAGLGNQPRALPHVRAAGRARDGESADGRMAAADASAAAAVRAVLRRQSDDGLGRPLAEQVAQGPPAGGRGQSVPRDAGERVAPDRRRASIAGGTDAKRWPSGRSCRSTARRRCRPRSASIPTANAPLAQGREEPAASRTAAEPDRRTEGAHAASAACAKPSSAGCSTSAWRARAVDERGFEMVRRIRRERRAPLPLAEFKAMVREQFFMLLIDQDAALAAIPAMLPADAEGAAAGARRHPAGAERARRTVGEDKARLRAGRPAVRRRTRAPRPDPFRPRQRELQAKAS